MLRNQAGSLVRTNVVMCHCVVEVDAGDVRQNDSYLLQVFNKIIVDAAYIKFSNINAEFPGTSMTFERGGSQCPREATTTQCCVK